MNHFRATQRVEDTQTDMVGRQEQGCVWAISPWGEGGYALRPGKSAMGWKSPLRQTIERFQGRWRFGDCWKSWRWRVSVDLHGEIQGGRRCSSRLSKEIEKRNPNASAGY